MARLTLYPEQQAIVDRMASEPTRAALNASELGAGKTVVSVELCRALGAKTILIIAPLNTKGGWRGTFRQQGIDLPFREIDSTKAGTAAFNDLASGTPGVYVTGREFFALSASSVEPKLKSPAILEFDARDLPAGTYTFDAIYDGNRKEYTVVVEDGEQDIFSIELEDMNDLQEASTTHPNATVHLPKFTRGRVARWSWAKVKPDIAIYDECFVAGTKIATPFGDRNIEDLVIGDLVYGYDHDCGKLVVTSVTATMSKQSRHVMPNGATANHPYYVEGVGYTPLADVVEGDQFVTITEDRTDVRPVPGTVYSVPEQHQAEVLRSEMLKSVPRYASGSTGRSAREDTKRGGAPEIWGAVTSNVVGTGVSRVGISEDAREESIKRSGNLAPSAGNQEGAWSILRSFARRQRSRLSSRAVASRPSGVRLDHFPFGGDGSRGETARVGEQLQDRLGTLRSIVGGGVRRSVTRLTRSTRTGRQEDGVLGKRGLDYLTILEPRDSQRYAEVRDTYSTGVEQTVYNIETASSNYFAAEALVHNCHAVSNRWSNGFAVLKTLKPGYKLALSATPSGNRFKGIWSVCRWLWPDDINPDTGEHYVARGQWAWAYQWANVSDDYFAGKVIGDEKVPGAFVASLPCYVRLESNLKDAQEIKVYVDLTPAQRKMYEQMQAQDLAWLEDNPLVADLPIVKQQRLRQMALGTVQFNEKDEVDFADDTSSAKIDALVEQIIPEHGDEPMLILTCSKKFAKVVAKRLGPTAVEWSGDVNAKTRAEIMTRFGKDVKYIVAQIQSVAEGIDGWQRVCHIVVWMSELVGNPTLNHQAAGRINRTGQTKTVLSYRLLANNTADDGTFDSLVAQGRSNRASLTI